jgi:hypothetical protein
MTTNEPAETILAANERALLAQGMGHHRGIEAGPAYRVDAATVSYRLAVIQEARGLFLALQADRRSFVQRV